MFNFFSIGYYIFNENKKLIRGKGQIYKNELKIKIQEKNFYFIKDQLENVNLFLILLFCQLTITIILQQLIQLTNKIIQIENLIMWGIKTKKHDLIPPQYAKIFHENSTPQTSSQSITAPKNQNIKTIEQILAIISNYKTVSKLFDLNQLKKTQKLQIRKYKQSVYYGQIHQFKRHGFGIMVYTTKRFYEGQWSQNFKSGQGYQQFVNGSIYQGQYKNGKPDGYGKYLWENGQIYEGQWVDGLKNGSGIWRGSKGDSYIGQWKDGKADGYGVHTWINGDRYEGQFVNCLKHGEGIQKFTNGDTYKGSYDNGKPSGYGQYFWSDGSFFKGQFKQGLRNGKGLWKKSNGDSDKYEGSFVDDKKQGQGIYTWQNGNIYKGSFQKDLKEGYGQMFWKDGRVYKGYWKNDELVDQNNIQFPAFSQQICETNPFEQLIFLNPQNFIQGKSYDEPNHPSMYQQKSFRSRGMSSRQFSRNQISKTQAATSRINDNIMITQSIYKPKLMKKQSMNIKMQQNSRSKKKFNHSVSQKKSMNSSFYMYNNQQENRMCKSRKNMGFSQRQFVCSKPLKQKLSSRQRQIKSSNGIRNIGRKVMNNQEQQFNITKQFVWSKNKSQYF